MAPVRYRLVPSMELEPLPHPQMLQRSPLPSQSSDSRSDLETSGTDRCRHDRRHGRLNTELLNAVLDGNLAEVSKRLELGASVHATCRRSRTSALQLAVTLGHAEVAQLLLCRGARVGVRDRKGRQAVHLAAANGRLLLLQLLLDSDPTVLDSPVSTGPQDAVDIHCLDSWNHDHTSISRKIPDLLKSATPLHLAVQRLHLDCVMELLQRGAKVDATDARGLTPLDVLGEIPTTSTASEGLVDVDDTSENTLARIENLKQRISGNPSLKPAVTRFNFSRDIKKNHVDTPSHSNLVRSSNDQTNFSNFKAKSVPGTPLPVSKPPSLPLKIVSELIKKGAKMIRSKVIVKQGGVQNQMTMPMTTLHTAVELQDTQLIECLLEHGACQLTWNNDGFTPLHLAVSKHLLESLKILLENNRSSKVVDARDTQGRTPLQLAVAENWFAGVSLLLEAGADVKVTSNDSQTVLHIAAAKSDPQLLEELLTIPESIKVIEFRNNHQETPLCCAVSAGEPMCVNLLLSHGADITTCLPGDITLLHLAAVRGIKSILETLLADRRITQQAGFKNIRSKESKGGTTALHLAALGGYVDCVRVLLAAGCDVCAVTTDHPHFGSTALHLAAFSGHLNVVEIIINHDKGTLCSKNGNGWFPLHVAARFGHKDCASHMLLNGANLASTVYDSGGFKKTALDIIVNSITNPLFFLEKIFDCCIEMNKYPLHNPKCMIKVRYDVLQPLGPHRKQMKVLDSLLNCGKMVVREKLLLHPLVETFLYLKWKKLRLFFFLMMLLYMIFTASLTTMAMLFYVYKAQSAAANDCVILCRCLLCISLTLMMLQELMNATRMQRYYVKDLESWVNWSAILLATVVVLAGHPAPWLAQVTSVAVLLSWLELLFLLSRWPSSLGFYILMFFTVAKNVLRVFATFTFVILGFTFAFMIQFEASEPFQTWWEALVKVLVMTLEFDYQSLNFDRVEGLNIGSVVGRAMFLSFMILVAIVLMNLLVGLAVSDIASLEKQGRAQRLAKQIEFLSLLEMFVYTRGLFSCCPTKISNSIKNFRATEPNLLIEPGKPLRKTKIILTQQLMSSVIDKIISSQETTRNVVRSWSNANKEVIKNHHLENDDVSHSESIELGRISNNAELKLQESLDLIVKELAEIKQQVLHLQQGTNGLALPSQNDGLAKGDQPINSYYLL